MQKTLKTIAVVSLLSAFNGKPTKNWDGDKWKLGVWLIRFVKGLYQIQLRSDYIESWVSYLNSSIMWHCVTIKRRSKASSSNRRLRLFFLIADQIDNQFFVSSQLCVTHRSIALHLWRQIWPTFHLFHFSDFFFFFAKKQDQSETRLQRLST